MTKAIPMQIDIVSDVVCPWCIIGYKNLEDAISRLDGEIDVTLRWHPFELNRDMPPEGQDLSEHISEKYGLTADQSADNRARITMMGENVGFPIHFGSDARIYNTFDAHRLLYWAGKEGEYGQQTALKLNLFAAYFQGGDNTADHGVLKRAVSVRYLPMWSMANSPFPAATRQKYSNRPFRKSRVRVMKSLPKRKTTPD